MKKFKLIFTAIVIISLSSFCFAQESEKKEQTEASMQVKTWLNTDSKGALKALEDAKEAERNKQWIHAVCYYLDAVELYPFNSKEARDRIKVITEAIAKGNPGPGEYNVFQMISAWKDLLLDAARYFTENCIYQISYGPWEMTNINMEKQTADYQAKVYFERNTRYIEINYLLENGYEKTYQSFWAENGLPSLNQNFWNWPHKFISQAPGKKIRESDNYYDLITDQKAYLVNGVAFVSEPYYRDYLKNEIGIKHFNLAFTEGYYDVDLKVVDNDGQEIVPTSRLLLYSVNHRYSNMEDRNSRYYIFQYLYAKDIPADKMSLFDKQIAKPIIDNVYLNYGYINGDDYKKSMDYNYGVDYLAFKKNLPVLSCRGRFSPDYERTFKIRVEDLFNKDFDYNSVYYLSSYKRYSCNHIKNFIAVDMIKNLKTVTFEGKKIKYAFYPIFGDTHDVHVQCCNFGWLHCKNNDYFNNTLENYNNFIEKFLCTIPDEVEKYKVLDKNGCERPILFYHIEDIE